MEIDRDEPALDEVSINVEMEGLRDESELSFCILFVIEADDADNQERKLELFNVDGFCRVDTFFDKVGSVIGAGTRPCK